MSFALGVRTSRVLLLILALLTGFYLYLCAHTFYGSELASSGDPEALRRAAALEPGNAQYWRELGAFSLYRSNAPQVALESFQRAAQLDPYDADSWIGQAYALEYLGRAEEEHLALARALAAEPARPEIAWDAANLYAVLGDRVAMIDNLRKVVAHDPQRAPDALALGWRLTQDVRAMLSILAEVPRDYGRLALLLAQTGNPQDAASVWQQMLARTGKVDDELGLQLVDHLIADHQFRLAGQVWDSLLERSANISPYRPQPPNLVVNAGFELPLLQSGFGWHFLTPNQLEIGIDHENFASGRGSLFVKWNSESAAAAVEQVVLVQPGRSYSFSFASRAGEFEGAYGPRVVLLDALTGKPCYTSGDLREFSDWRVSQAKVWAPSEALVIRVMRDTPGDLRGVLWLDDFKLEATDEPAGANSRATRGACQLETAH